MCVLGHVLRHPPQAIRAGFGIGSRHHGRFAVGKTVAQCLAHRYRAVAFVLVWQQLLRHEQQPLDTLRSVGLIWLGYALLFWLLHTHMPWPGGSMGSMAVLSVTLWILAAKLVNRKKHPHPHP